MNIKEAYSKEMLKAVESWYDYAKGGICNRTAGYVKGIKTADHVYADCGDPMSSFWSKDNRTIQCLYPAGTVEDLKSFEKVAKLWVQMMGEMFIPLRYVGVQDIEEIEGLNGALKGSLSRNQNTLKQYKKSFVIEYQTKDFMHSTHFKIAHTSFRYLFRREMVSTAYHTMKMKLMYPAVSVLECMVAASYFADKYYSYMMMFTWHKDYIKFTSRDRTFKMPTARSRGEVFSALKNQDQFGDSKKTKMDRITSFYTKSYDTGAKSPESAKMNKHYKFILDKVQDGGTKSNYMAVLKKLRELQLKKDKHALPFIS